MTYDSDAMTAILGFSPFSNHLVGYSDYYLLPENRSQLNDAMCGRNNREGILCSRCMQGYGPSVLSYPHTCVKCSGKWFCWFLYILVALIPYTALISVNVVLFPQIRYVPFRIPKLLYGIGLTLDTAWNLDFFRLIIPPFCVSEHLSNLQVLAMDYNCCILSSLPDCSHVCMYPTSCQGLQDSYLSVETIWLLLVSCSKEIQLESSELNCPHASFLLSQVPKSCLYQ